jgi:uncharacterized membrane protein YdjX (TVP38/TMEM64 family)
VLTLAGGAIFGLVIGTILISFASTIGATLAFLVARFLLRDSVQRRFGDRLQKINGGYAGKGLSTSSLCAWCRSFPSLSSIW